MSGIIHAHWRTRLLSPSRIALLGADHDVWPGAFHADTPVLIATSRGRVAETVLEAEFARDRLGRRIKHGSAVDHIPGIKQEVASAGFITQPPKRS